jgi:hypothetical protein
MLLFWSIFLKPFIAVFFFLIVAMITRFLYRVIPNGRIKRILFSPLPGHRNRRWPDPYPVHEKVE